MSYDRVDLVASTTQSVKQHLLLAMPCSSRRPHGQNDTVLRVLVHVLFHQNRCLTLVSNAVQRNSSQPTTLVAPIVDALAYVPVRK
jgi:hypothetical protein